jgi:hypothetical protein
MGEISEAGVMFEFLIEVMEIAGVIGENIWENWVLAQIVHAST